MVNYEFYPLKKENFRTLKKVSGHMICGISAAEMSVNIFYHAMRRRLQYFSIVLIFYADSHDH